jgi:hypothetical protein
VRILNDPRTLRYEIITSIPVQIVVGGFSCVSTFQFRQLSGHKRASAERNTMENLCHTAIVQRVYYETFGLNASVRSYKQTSYTTIPFISYITRRFLRG